ncbi:MAG: hypothetical protein V2B20_24495, partial [Pseudomonadota bacterium]
MSHYSDPMTATDHGRTRNSGDASDAVKAEVSNMLVSIAEEYINQPNSKLSESDIPNLLEFVYHESGFNPSAANPNSNASGVFQLMGDDVVRDIDRRSPQLKNHTGIDPTTLGTYDRFDIESGIRYGIFVYLEKKYLAGGEGASFYDIYKKYNPRASDSLIERLQNEMPESKKWLGEGSTSANDPSLPDQLAEQAIPISSTQGTDAQSQANAAAREKLVEQWKDRLSGLQGNVQVYADSESGHVTAIADNGYASLNKDGSGVKVTKTDGEISRPIDGPTKGLTSEKTWFENGEITKTETRKDSADGNYSSIETQDGSGSSKYERQDNPDGTTKESYAEYNADGTKKSETTTTSNADGSEYKIERRDGDGNPLSSDERSVDADGNITDTHKQYDADGNLKNEFIIKKSADGSILSMEIKDGNGNTIDFYEAPLGEDDPTLLGDQIPPPPTPQGAKDWLPNYVYNGSPLILDLDGDGVETRSVADNIQFDLDNNGFRETVGWVGADDGLLALDKNGDGQITGGTELFGNHTILASGGKAANGFSALAEYDDNKDGRIDANDAVFSQLKVWRDLDADGVSDAGELIGLAETGVARLNLTITASSGKDAQGNDHRLVGSYVDTGGASHTMTDVWFTIDPTRTTPVTAISIPEEIKALPDAMGFGKVRSLRETMALDDSGKLQQLVEEFVAATDAQARAALLPKLLFQWTGGKPAHLDNSYPGNIFSNNITQEEYTVLEAFLGVTRFFNTEGSAAVLHNRYQQLEDMVFYQLMAQSHLKDIYQNIDFHYDEASKTWRGDYRMAAVFVTMKVMVDPENTTGLVGDFLR